MKRSILFVVLIVSFLSFVSCSSKPPPKPTRPGYSENAVVFHLDADPMLNLYEGQPHTLLLCIYQLQDPNAFNQYREDYSGISKLLEGTRFDPSVAASKRIFVQPGEHQGLVLDRAEGARYVGVVAGYYNMQKDQTSRLFKVPLVEEKKGWIRRKTTIRFDTLEVSLKLGAESLHEQGRVQAQ